MWSFNQEPKSVQNERRRADLKNVNSVLKFLHKGFFSLLQEYSLLEMIHKILQRKIHSKYFSKFSSLYNSNHIADFHSLN
jgi:hypothetical protein